MTQPVSLIEDLASLLDADLRYEYEERAGIIEFDAEVPRDEAECLALIDLLRTHPDALVQLTVLQVDIGGSPALVLTTDLEAARARFDAVPSVSIRISNLAEVVRVQFGGVALITSLG